MVFGSALALATATPALAASDYLLVIDGVDGESSSAAPLESWSFGQSNPSSTMASGRTVAPRDAQSGMATGKLRESPTRASTGVALAGGGDCDDTDCKGRPDRVADVDGDGALDFAQATRLDQIGPLTLTLSATSDAARMLCGKTGHLRSGHIVKSDGTIYDLSNFAFGACTTQGSFVRLAAGDGKIKHKTGHVTLIK
ncbi:hypothetical protein SZ64_05955 [Erythrobacter sp. SG61-1L]|nr:hypothetical protein SZ64_05955 [Erythrobacter sp. SG61-1L]